MSTTIDLEPGTELPDHYEVVNGVIVEVPPMSGFAGEVANRIRDELAFYARTSGLGRARNDMLFRIPLPEDRTRNRSPDTAFISYSRWPEDRPMPQRGNAVDVVPDLLVEVASPTDGAEELIGKAHEYLRAGAELVWVVFPRLRQLYAYRAAGTAPVLFTAGDTLETGNLLPGFSVPMAGLFPIPADEPDAGNRE